MKHWLPNIQQPTPMIENARLRVIESYLCSRRYRRLSKLPLIGGLFKEKEIKIKKFKWKNRYL